MAPSPGLAQSGVAPQSADASAALRQVEVPSPELPEILPLKQRAAIRDAWLADRLDAIVPPLMKENGVDMWIMVAREYLEDPVVSTMLNATSLRARRRTILIMFDPGDGKPFERLTVSRYGLAGLFAPSWEPEKEADQWKRLGQLVAERDPKKIAINTSDVSAFADGLTLSQFKGVMSALGPKYQQRIVASDGLAVGWLETRTASEMKAYPDTRLVVGAVEH